MAYLRMLSISAFAFAALTAGAQTSADHAVHHPTAAASASALAAGRMADMDAHMKAMQVMHEQMTNARTPEQRQALMAEHMRLMQQGMSMMGGTAPGMHMGMGAMSGGKGMPGMPGGSMSSRTRLQMMDERMDMMQSMMQVMMDRMQSVPVTK